MRVGWFQGDAQEPEYVEDATVGWRSQDAIQESAEANSIFTPVLRVLLIPDDAKLTDLDGDDWNDAPANCNASEPYRVPEGSQWLELRLGDPWPVYVREP